MSILDLFDSGEHSRNLSHYANIVYAATSDGTLTTEEQAMLERFARKLDITKSEVIKVMENPIAYPINPPNTSERRLQRLFDLFTVVYSDNEMDASELRIVKRYAAGLGFSDENAEEIIKRSIQIFEGGFSFEDYKYLLEK